MSLFFSFYSSLKGTINAAGYLQDLFKPKIPLGIHRAVLFCTFPYNLLVAGRYPTGPLLTSWGPHSLAVLKETRETPRRRLYETSGVLEKKGAALDGQPATRFLFGAVRGI